MPRERLCHRLDDADVRDWDTSEGTADVVMLRGALPWHFDIESIYQPGDGGERLYVLLGPKERRTIADRLGMALYERREAA